MPAGVPGNLRPFYDRVDEATGSAGCRPGPHGRVDDAPRPGPPGRPRSMGVRAVCPRLWHARRWFWTPKTSEPRCLRVTHTLPSPATATVSRTSATPASPARHRAVQRPAPGAIKPPPAATGGRVPRPPSPQPTAAVRTTVRSHACRRAVCPPTACRQAAWPMPATAFHTTSRERPDRGPRASGRAVPPPTAPTMIAGVNSCRCPICAGDTHEIRAKLICRQCGAILETCCEGGPMARTADDAAIPSSGSEQSDELHDE